jgi:cytochrome P450
VSKPTLLPARRPLGHLATLRRDPLMLFAQALGAADDAVRMRFASREAWALFEPALVKHVLVDHTELFDKGTRGYDTLRLLLGDGLVTSDGDFWLRQRRIAQPAFHKKSIARFGDVMAEAAESLADGWRFLKAPIDVAGAMTRLALRIAGLTLFGEDLTDETAEVSRAVDVALGQFRRRVSSPLPPGLRLPTAGARAFDEAVSTLDRVVFQMIADRRAATDPGTDLLGLFMAARDAETGEAMNDRQLRDELITMLLAGHETTANALAWTILLLAQHPDWADRLAADLRARLDGRAPTVSEAMELPLLDQVFQESLRLYPPVWAVGRRVVEAHRLGPFDVDVGTYIFVSQYALHRHPRFWRHPDRFDPTRFAPDSDELPEGDRRYAYLPFLRGRRQCIGDQFARLESLIILATLLQRFRFRLVGDRPIVPEASVTLRPRGGVHVHVEPRR